MTLSLNAMGSLVTVTHRLHRTVEVDELLCRRRESRLVAQGQGGGGTGLFVSGKAQPKINEMTKQRYTAGSRFVSHTQS